MPPPDGEPRDARGPAARPARGPSRLPRAVRALEPEQRIAAGAALALWISMFLPWYGKSVTETVKNSLRAADYDLSAFGAFSFVEAAVLLVASAVLVLLFARGERRAFHLPGGDGLVILAGGVWVSLLIFYRMLDKPGTTGNDRLTATVGLQWGIFFALAASISLAYAGARVRAAHRPEPTLRDDPTIARDVAGPPAARRRAPGPGRPPRSPRPPRPGERADGRAGERAPTRVQTSPRRRPPVPPAAPPFDADAETDVRPTVDFDPGRTTRPPESDQPTRIVRRVPRFDDLDAGWTSTDELSLEADPPAAPEGER